MVWVDFEAESTELPAILVGFSGAPQLVTFGKTSASDIADAKATVLAALEADYNGEAAYSNGFTVSLVTAKPASGDYSTLSFVVPEPSTLALLGLGSPDAVPVLRDHFQRETAPAVRLTILRQLARIDTPESGRRWRPSSGAPRMRGSPRRPPRSSG